MLSAATSLSGWCPFADTSHRSPNHFPGREGHAVKAVVLHVAAGAYGSSIGWMCNPSSQVSSHFIISKSGQIAQLVSVNDGAWANGASYENGHWVDPEGHTITPPWVGMEPGTNPNDLTISVEHEGQPADLWTPAMSDANTRLLRWLAAQFPVLAPYIPGKNLIGHCDISPISRPNCPGPHVNYAAIAAAANPPPAPPAALQYRALVVCPVWQEPTLLTLAQDGSGYASLNAGGEYFIDSVKGGIGHLDTGVGFVPMSVLERAT